MQYLIRKSKPEDYRRELKYTFYHSDRVILRQQIKTHPAHFSEIYYPRWVNNIYWDSQSLDAYHSSIEGLSPRLKIRMRWYGEFFGIIQPMMEIKIKNASKNTKATFPLNSINLYEGINAFELRQNLLSGEDLPDELKDAFKCLRPTMANRYLRDYYQTDDKHFRITVDSFLGFKSVMNSPSLRMIRPDLAHMQILELKFNQDCGGAGRIMKEFGSHFQLCRMSKYTTGLET